MLREFYGIDGRRCLNSNGFSIVKSYYDERNYFIRSECFGVDKKPINNSRGYTKLVQSYSDNNNTRIRRYYNTKGDLVDEKID